MLLVLLLSIAICPLVFRIINGSSNPITPINLGQQVEDGVYQGDIVFHYKQRNGVLKRKQWPGGVIYYRFEGELDEDHLDVVNGAIKSIEKYTCVRFEKYSDQENYVVIRKGGSRCLSDGVGMVGGEQYLTLSDSSDGSCMVHHIIIHEMLHIIGLWHEHTRYDRDKYITIHKENIPDRWLPQFEIVPENQSSTYGVPYNYLSIMHYDAFTTSSNGKITMEPNDKRYLYEIGHQPDAHELDWEKVRRLYGCQGVYPKVVRNVNCLDNVTYCSTYLERCGKDHWSVNNCRKSCNLCWNGHGPPDITLGTTFLSTSLDSVTSVFHSNYLWSILSVLDPFNTISMIESIGSNLKSHLWSVWKSILPHVKFHIS